MMMLLKLALLFTLFLFIVVLVVLGVARFTYHDPFALYAALMPGLSMDALVDYPCQLRTKRHGDVEDGLCEFTPETGPFGRVTVIERDHRITQVDFLVRPDSLYVGDLILCWGGFQPTAFSGLTEGSIGLYLSWGSRMSAATSAPYGTPISDFTPISYLSLRDQVLPCDSAK